MAIIDEKGRLFGKINVIDLLVVLALLGAIPVSYLVYRIFKMPSAAAPAVSWNTRDIDLNCKFIEVKPEIVKLIAVGDKDMHESGAQAGEILWVGESRLCKLKLDLVGKVIEYDDLELKEVPVKLKVRAEIRESFLYYKDQRIDLGKPFEFTCEKYAVKAQPYIKEKTMIKVDRLAVNVIFKNLTNDLLNLIAVGDKEADENGGVVAEILKLGKIDSNTYNIDLKGASPIRGQDLNARQLYVEIALKCGVTEDGEFFYKGRQVDRDSVLTFKTDKYSVEFVLSQVYEAVTPPLKEKWLAVKVKFSGLAPEIYKVINDGDTETNPAGQARGKLKMIISSGFSEMLSFSNNQVVMLSHPFNKDVIADIELLCVEKEGIYYFKNYPVKIGNFVVFTTDLYSISGMVVDLEKL